MGTIVTFNNGYEPTDISHYMILRIFSLSSIFASFIRSAASCIIKSAASFSVPGGRSVTLANISTAFSCARRLWTYRPTADRDTIASGACCRSQSVISSIVSLPASIRSFNSDTMSAFNSLRMLLLFPITMPTCKLTNHDYNGISRFIKAQIVPQYPGHSLY